MNPILSHPLFAEMVCEHVRKSLDKPKLTCDFCSFTGTDPENFGEDKKTCARCQGYLDCMRIYDMSLDDITKRFGLLGTIQAMESSIGSCAPTGAILVSFKNFFLKLRSIPEIRKAISESLENERRRKEDSSD